MVVDVAGSDLEHAAKSRAPAIAIDREIMTTVPLRKRRSGRLWQARSAARNDPFDGGAFSRHAVPQDGPRSDEVEVHHERTSARAQERHSATARSFPSLTVRPRSRSRRAYARLCAYAPMRTMQGLRGDAALAQKLAIRSN